MRVAHGDLLCGNPDMSAFRSARSPGAMPPPATEADLGKFSFSSKNIRTATTSTPRRFDNAWNSGSDASSGELRINPCHARSGKAHFRAWNYSNNERIYARARCRITGDTSTAVPQPSGALLVLFRRSPQARFVFEPSISFPLQRSSKKGESDYDSTKGAPSQL